MRRTNLHNEYHDPYWTFFISSYAEDATLYYNIYENSHTRKVKSMRMYIVSGKITIPFTF
jgi:hypothetical protein